MKKRLLAISMLLVMVLGLFSVYAAADNNQAVMDCREGVVRVVAIFPGGGVATGSAFGIGDAGRETDTFVTNTHVVYDGEYGQLAQEVYIATTDDAVKLYYDNSGNAVNCELDYGELIECEVLHYEGSMYPDVAVIRAEDEVPGRVALPLMDDDSVEATEEVFALGFPAQADMVQIGSDGEQYLKSSAEAVYVTNGTVANVTEAPAFGNTYLILHDAVINSGNSGGPLINTDGVVVAINTYGYNEGGGLSTTQYAAVHMEEVLAILDDEGIDYDTGSGSASSGGSKSSKSDDGESFGKILLYAAIAAGVLAVAAVVLVLVRKSLAQAEKTAAAVGAGKKVDDMPKTVAAKDAVVPSVNDGKPRLQCVSGVFEKQRFSIDGQVRIGRDPARNDLVFPGDTQGISGAHCVVIYDRGVVYLNDLGSAYGTYLANGHRLTPNQPVQLQVGDRFYLGSDKQMFVIDGYRGAAPAAPVAPAAPMRTAPAAPARPVPAASTAPAMPTVLRLQGIRGHFANQRFAIDGRVRIGRDPNKNDLIYPGDTQGISGAHCMLVLSNGIVWLEDLGSTYGTYLGDGRRLPAGSPVQLKAGDHFWLGSERETFAIVPKGGI